MNGTLFLEFFCEGKELGCELNVPPACLYRVALDPCEVGAELSDILVHFGRADGLIITAFYVGKQISMRRSQSLVDA